MSDPTLQQSIDSTTHRIEPKLGGKRTRKNHSHHEYACGVTYHGLHKWYAAKFEKLGWMVLAHERGHHDKITCYKVSTSAQNGIRIQNRRNRKS